MRLKRIIPIALTLCVLLLTFSCAKEQVIPEPDSAEISFASNYEKGPVVNNLKGVKGIWNPTLGACVPPRINCTQTDNGDGTNKTNHKLIEAVEDGTLAAFWKTPEGEAYLNEIDPRIKEDLLADRITIKPFHSEYFFVFPQATGPYDGYDYSQPDRQVIHSSIIPR